MPMTLGRMHLVLIDEADGMTNPRNWPCCPNLTPRHFRRIRFSFLRAMVQTVSNPGSSHVAAPSSFRVTEWRPRLPLFWNMSGIARVERRPGVINLNLCDRNGPDIRQGQHNQSRPGRGSAEPGPTPVRGSTRMANTSAFPITNPL
jgi:hypothetical protein